MLGQVKALASKGEAIRNSKMMRFSPNRENLRFETPLLHFDPLFFCKSGPFYFWIPHSGEAVSLR